MLIKINRRCSMAKISLKNVKSNFPIYCLTFLTAIGEMVGNFGNSVVNAKPEDFNNDNVLFNGGKVKTQGGFTGSKLNLENIPVKVKTFIVFGYAILILIAAWRLMVHIMKFSRTSDNVQVKEAAKEGIIRCVFCLILLGCAGALAGAFLNFL